MSDLDSMSKDELLEEAKARGVSPANAAMTKAELRAALEGESEPEDEPARPGQRVTTTMTKDYLNRPLVNPTPGTSQATDYLGRSVVVTNKDFLGRALVA